MPDQHIGFRKLARRGNSWSTLLRLLWPVCQCGKRPRRRTPPPPVFLSRRRRFWYKTAACITDTKLDLDDPGSFRVVRIVLENTRYSMFSGRPGAHHHWSQSIYVSDLMAKVLSDLKRDYV